ncbi:MAG TPA: hypothetical protein VG406_10295 [Isosphaeraceae bacterium]|nr:hypothetical protein [Isosphaeraceae bacterium]
MSTDVVVDCPQCGSRLRVPGAHLGKRVKCPACGTIVATVRPEAEAEAVPAARPAPRRPAREFEPLRFGVRVKYDPAGILKGSYQGELSAEGLVLRKPKRDEVEASFPVGTPVRSPGQGILELKGKGRVLTLVVARWNSYNERLADDLARFLAGEIDLIEGTDYDIPRPLLVLALLPIGIGAVGMSGGALGGGVCGGIAGGLITGNLAIIRRERWPMGVRVASCVGLSLVGYATLALFFVALAVGMRRAQPPAPPAQGPTPRPVVAPKAVDPGPKAKAPEGGWGAVEDPDGDCEARVVGDAATIEVPGTVHDLAMPPGKANAPRILRPVDGDFTAEVRVVGEVKPTDPPAGAYGVAYHGAGLFLRSSGGEMVRLERAAFVRGGRLTTYVNFELHRTSGWPDSVGHAVADGPVRLRLQRRGDQMLGAFSTDDGASWTSLPPKQLRSSPPRVKVGVAAVNTAAKPFTAHLERLTIQTP